MIGALYMIDFGQLSHLWFSFWLAIIWPPNCCVTCYRPMLAFQIVAESWNPNKTWGETTHKRPCTKLDAVQNPFLFWKFLSLPILPISRVTKNFALACWSFVHLKQEQEWQIIGVIGTWQLLAIIGCKPVLAIITCCKVVSAKKCSYFTQSPPPPHSFLNQHKLPFFIIVEKVPMWKVILTGLSFVKILIEKGILSALFVNYHIGRLLFTTYTIHNMAACVVNVYEQG